MKMSFPETVCTAKFSETPLEMAYVHQLWWTFLQSVCQLHASSKLATSVVVCCVIKLHILEWPIIVASLRHTCYATPVRWMDYFGKGEVLTSTDLDRFVNNI